MLNTIRTLARGLFLVLVLASCNLPADSPTPSLVPPTPKLADLPTALPPVVPTAVPATAAPATPSLPPLPSATPPPAFDRANPQAVINALRDSLSKHNTAAFEQLAQGSALNYVNYIEGGQPVERAKLLADLQQRMAASNPACDAYGTYDNMLQLWTSGWAPEWEMTQNCVIGGCAPISPAWKSSRAGFFFKLNPAGQYELQTVWVNKDTLWTDVYQVQMRACGEAYAVPPVPTLSCPGAPATRLKVGGYASASTATSTSNNVRSAPGKGANVLGLLAPGKGAEIIGGPQCVEGMVWWKVRLLQGNLTGWTVEGQGSDYWLVPCTSATNCGK